MFKPIPAVFALLGLIAAGIVHLIIVPDHFSHAPAHGLFFGIVGIIQVVLAVAWLIMWRKSSFPTFLLGLSAAFSGGLITLWLMTQVFIIPFADTPEPLDWSAVASKLTELIVFVAVIAQLSSSRPLPRPLARFSSSGTARRLASSSAVVIVSLLAGVVYWGGGIAATPLFPALGHDHSTHSHSAPTAATVNTTAYLSIVNSGKDVDTLVSASADVTESVTLHKTTIEANVARMRSQDGVELPRHTRVDFAPGGSHIMLDNLAQNLYAGDLVTLTLYFASGRSAQVEFTVLDDAPPSDERVNFVKVENFQITNAWVRATANANGLVSVTDGGYPWELPVGFPIPPVPSNNPMTTEKVELGRYLFYDPRLSVNETISCSSCHLQSLAFTDGKSLSPGATGELTARSAQALVNVAYNATYTWANPLLLVLERQIVIPMFGEHPIEMGITGHEDEVLNRFRRDEQYQTMFAAAFPADADPFSFGNVTLSLASFIRTLISGNSAYDRYLQGDKTALSESAKRGMDMFFSEGLECHHCHTGFNLSLSTQTANSTFEERPFFNTGLYNLDGNGAFPHGNTGIHEITNKPEDMGKFRPPTLRNIALTAPYMHDGSILTLPEVLKFYMDGGRVITEGEYAGDGRTNPYKSGLVPGFTLTDQEVADLVAYLESLTDEQFITDPRFSNPFTAGTTQLMIP